MVRLLPSPPTKIHHIFHGFNPTMVRLLLSTTTSNSVSHSSFQSHNGAIAAPASEPASEPASSFQSHNGAIAALKEISLPTA